MKKCIVFDLDRTVVDSYMTELVSLKEAMETVLGKKFDEDQMKKLTSLPTIDFFNYYHITDEQIININKEWERTYSKNKTKCFPKIKEVIKELYSMGYILGVITSRTDKELHELDKELMDISDLFKVVVTTDCIKKPKPDRESLDYLCNKLNLTNEEVVYVGDNENDKVFSQNCNIDFIPAIWENKDLESDENACHNIEDLIDKIKELEDIKKDRI